MRTLEQIQQENRKLIIIANNPEAKDFDEALEMDQKDLRKTLLDNLIMAYWCERVWEAWGVGTMSEDDFSEIEDGDDGFEDLVQDLYKPLTLNRILLSLPKLDFWMLSKTANASNLIFNKADYIGNKNKVLFSWDLTKETLEEQTEETQREINELLT